MVGASAIAREPIADRTLMNRRAPACGRRQTALDLAIGRSRRHQRDCLDDVDLLIACEGALFDTDASRAEAFVPPVTHFGSPISGCSANERDRSRATTSPNGSYNGPNRLLAYAVRRRAGASISAAIFRSHGEDVGPAQKTAAALQAAYLPREAPFNPHMQIPGRGDAAPSVEVYR